MKKYTINFKALFFGYLFFKVNGKKFFLYSSARAYRKNIKGGVYFDGFHVLNGWVTFFIRTGIFGIKHEHNKLGDYYEL